MTSSADAATTTTASSSCPQNRTWVRGGCVGRGSFGVVSLAADKATGNVFAVKTVPVRSSCRTSLLSLENEIRVYRAIASSPYIVEYLGDDVTRESSSGEPCRNLHMEYMPGGSVGELAVERRKAASCIPECDIRSYTTCLVEALRFLHGSGIVHCDVKGRNVLLGHAQGTAKLADFGSARREIDVSGPEGMQGTPLWMAPEVVRGESQTPRSDVWSLGCTLIEMFAGRPPWTKQEAYGENALFRIGFGYELPVFPAEMSKLGRDFADKCLRRNPEERWSCEELLRHPFLVETAEMESSPRSVIGWVGSEEDECSSVHAASSVDSMDLRARIGGLAGPGRGNSDGGGAMAGWDDDGGDWEVVRGEAAEAEERCCHQYRSSQAENDNVRATVVIDPFPDSGSVSSFCLCFPHRKETTTQFSWSSFLCLFIVWTCFAQMYIIPSTSALYLLRATRPVPSLLCFPFHLWFMALVSTH